MDNRNELNFILPDRIAVVGTREKAECLNYCIGKIEGAVNLKY